MLSPPTGRGAGVAVNPPNVEEASRQCSRAEVKTIDTPNFDDLDTSRVGLTAFDEVPKENPSLYPEACPGRHYPMTWFTESGFLPTSLHGVTEDEMRGRIKEATAVLKEPRTDPNLYPARRRQGRQGILSADMSAREKARTSNRVAAERKRAREAEHRDFCMVRVARLEAEMAYLKAQIILLGGDPTEFNLLPTWFTNQFAVPVNPTAPKVGQKAKIACTKQDPELEEEGGGLNLT
ncbi:unnamed protein product [Parascedosporium putredinis]|uniref:BZIP domain-containing protein n=1 Tax=Parascedosporium putredinis TaxID=1442378 RepID=A0A9P1M7L5_9PEZI|nr:unnamed protein product [Parascedosporium putredinis]CAI7987823.1 unnamed protein product [Parascedosporium putredinis]